MSQDLYDAHQAILEAMESLSEAAENIHKHIDKINSAKFNGDLIDEIRSVKETIEELLSLNKQ